jgi:hypothetical protein
VFDTVDALEHLTEEAGIPFVTLAVAWCLAQPAITSPIIGASRPAQLQASVAAFDVTLHRRIDKLTTATGPAPNCADRARCPLTLRAGERGTEGSGRTRRRPVLGPGDDGPRHQVGQEPGAGGQGQQQEQDPDQ